MTTDPQHPAENAENADTPGPTVSAAAAEAGGTREGTGETAGSACAAVPVFSVSTATCEVVEAVTPTAEGTAEPPGGSAGCEVLATAQGEATSGAVETGAVETGVAETGVAETGVAETGVAETGVASAAARVREMMASATGAEPVVSEGAPSAPSDVASGRKSVEIPRADALEESLEAEIQRVMSHVEAVAPAPAVAVEPHSGEPPAAAEPTKEIGKGAKVRGRVQQIHGDDVFVDAGLRTSVVVSLKQFPEDKRPEVGSELDVVIEELDADGLMRGRVPRGRHRPGGQWEALAVGQVVDCMVGAVNKGGLQIAVSGLRGFLPASQIELGFAGNLEAYVGQKLTVQVTEVNPRKRNLVVSRRALLEAERAEGEGEFWSKVEVGQDFSGTVKTIKDYGAFVNIGVVDGFLHIGEISWSRINHPNELLQEGQTVDVRILKLDPEKKRVSLGMKQLAQNPWSTAAEKYTTGRVVSGKVTRITDFGAFVELEPGLEGMVHISELAWRRVGSVAEVLTVGEVRDFQVQDLDAKRKRVALSLKALEKRPEPVRTEHSEPAEAPPTESRKPRNQNLRGGTERNASRGGLFGNPSDFT